MSKETITSGTPLTTATDITVDLLAEIASKVQGQVVFRNTQNLEAKPVVVEVNGKYEQVQPLGKGLICNTYDLGYEFPEILTPDMVKWIADEYDITPDPALGGGVLEGCAYEMTEKGVTKSPAQFFESGELRLPEQRSAFYSADRPAEQWVGDYGSKPPWVTK